MQLRDVLRDVLRNTLGTGKISEPYNRLQKSPLTFGVMATVTEFWKTLQNGQGQIQELDNQYF